MIRHLKVIGPYLFAALLSAAPAIAAYTGLLPNNTVLGNVSGSDKQAVPLTAAQLATLVGGGGGTLDVTDGTHSVSPTSTLTFGPGFVVGGSAGSATANSAVPDRSVASGGTTIGAGDVGGQVNSTDASPQTFTQPSTLVLGNGQTVVETNQGAGTVALSGGQTLNGLAASSLYQYGWAACTGNGSSADCFGFPGWGALSGGLSCTAAGVCTLSAGAGGQLIGVQRITATGSYTYTPDAGTSSVVIELQGAGGGGGGVAVPSSGQINIGAGAGGGCWIRVRLTANFSGATGSVGAHGAGGTAGNNPGGNGNNTTFVTTAGSPVTYTAGGGTGGTQSGSQSAPNVAGSVGGGTCTNGDDQVPGGPSTLGIAPGSTVVSGGGGGPSRYDTGAGPPFIFSSSTSAAGNAATGKGGGGSGAVANASSSAKAGGNGADGEVIIWEYN